MYKIACSHHIPDEAVEILKGRAELIYPTEEEHRWKLDVLSEKMTGCDGMYAVSHAVPGDLMRAHPECRVIGSLGTGYDNVDVKTASELGIAIINTPDSVVGPTAEIAVSVILDMMRGIYRLEKFAHERLKAGVTLFPRQYKTLQGKTVGIVGFGRIGQDVARKLKGFDVNILYYGHHPVAPEVEKELNARAVSFDELLAQSDIVSLHCPLRPENHHLINAEALAKMKPGSYLVNIARGPVVDEAALKEALRSGHLAGAGLDVHEFEPAIDPELAGMENVVITPHIGTSSFDARVSMCREALEGMLEYLDGKRPHNLVNPEILNK